MYRKPLIVVAAILALTVGAGVAHAGEQSQVKFPTGSFSINWKTCVFLHAEQDPPLGSSWAVGKINVAYEDGRHDVRMACNARRQTRVIACFATPIPPVTEKHDHGVGNPGDEKGAAAALAAVRTIQSCVLAAGGLVAP